MEARIARSQSSLAGSLGDIRVQPDAVLPPADREIRAFQLSLARNMGLKRDASKGSFIETVISGTEDFYRLVLQGLRRWKATPPKLKPKELDVPEDAPPAPPEVEEALEEAQREKQAEAARVRDAD